MKKLSEKAFKLLARAKTNAADNGVSRLNIHCIEAAFLDLYRSFLLTTVRKDRIMIAVDAMSTAMRTRNVSVSHIGLDREIQDFLEGSETETLTLPDFWTLVCSSPNSAFNAEALGEEAVEKLTETFRKIENGEAPSIGGVGGEMPMDGEDSFDWHTCCVDLVEQVKDYKKPFIGREDVIEDTIRTLVRMDKCNPCHVGEPGVGKTAVTLGLARKIATGDVPKALKNASLFEVDLAGMLAGSVFRGQFEQRLKTTLEGVLEESENPILFIDEIHTIVGAGSTGTSSMDASNILKPFLTEGKIKFIGATTYDEYRQHIEKDKALARRFQKIDIVEPSIEDAIKIVDGLKDAYGEHHGVTYHSEAIESAVRLSAKYMTDRFLPDKAIDLIDEAGAHHNIHPELGKDIVGADIEQVLTRLCHIPKITNEEEDFNSVRNLESALKERVFGQDKAVKALSDAIKLSKSGLTDGEKPMASFLFVGPSGVGKTALTKEVADKLGIPLLRFDMSEFQEKHSVAKLTGAPAGYVGYEDGGLLTEAVRKTPHCVVLFDEIEKAHPDIFKVFLQVMDYGTLTDNRGRKADFRNTVIVMTSNAGATVAAKKSLGFNSGDKSGVNIDGITDAVNATFTPEFRNRLTDIIVFNGINDEIGAQVVRKELDALINKLQQKKINASFTDACIKRLADLGVSDVYGAREIQRVIDAEIRKLFVEAIINGEKLDNCLVDYEDKFVIKPSSRRKNKS